MRQRISHSIEFKRQVAQAYLEGETLHALAKRHDLSRNLIRIWVQKLEVGGLDEDVGAAALLEEYETRIATLERMVGCLAAELSTCR
jgi:transposase-like protein